MQPFLALITPVGNGGGGGGSPPPQVNWPTFPSNPIVRPPWGWGSNNPPPLGIWGGGGVGDYIDAGFPGPQPGKPPQIWGGPYFPPVIWPGPGPLPYPDQGLPGQQPEGDRTPKVEWKTAWSPSTGWIVVGVPTGEHVTPSTTAAAAKPTTPPTTPPKP